MENADSQVGVNPRVNSNYWRYLTVWYPQLNENAGAMTPSRDAPSFATHLLCQYFLS